MRIPIATYRLQFTPDFGFTHALEQLEYLDQLGISDLYASPIFKARQGSSHGYDVVDHNQLNPELGTGEQFSALAAEVGRRQMGWLQDIVPNHMAVDGRNGLLAEVLEHGPETPSARIFDIDWSHADGLRQQILLPLLGQFFGRALEAGELNLDYNQAGFGLSYYQLRVPLRIASYHLILQPWLELCRQTPAAEPSDLTRLEELTALSGTLQLEKNFERRFEQSTWLKQKLWQLHEQSPALQNTLRQVLQGFNGEKGRPQSFNRLEQLLAEQWFRLAFWKLATEEVNYRRFFCINELISLAMEHPPSFERIHQLSLRLVAEGKLTGLRIDHIDGLHHPRGYLEQLRGRLPDTYLVTEKILAPQEDLPDWPVQGTTGYDFLNLVNALFCCRTNEKEMTRVYQGFIRRAGKYKELVVEKKRLILDRHMAGDISNLVRQLKNLARRYRYSSDLAAHGLNHALTEVMVRLPLYRTYLAPGETPPADLAVLDKALQHARVGHPGLVNELDFIGKVLRLEFDACLAPSERGEWLNFCMRFQQFTGPLMAKGFEDTLLYNYNRLLSLNEVGGTPDRFGLSATDFHACCRQRRHLWPHAMNASSTHDTKRGEDIRARLNVLSEIPRLWRQAVQEWSQLNRPLKRSHNRRKVPDRNDEYFLYQTLLGAWPAQASEGEDFSGRLTDYLVKAVREAKVHTAWIKPDQAYEEAYTGFAAALLDPQHEFLKHFLPFQQKIAFFGMLNSLAQTLIKITAPGIPDFYQGSELWDLSLVDPDNRRPVDYARRGRALQMLQKAFAEQPQQLLNDLFEQWPDGRIKLFLIHRALQARRRCDTLFKEGSYEALPATGDHSQHVLAFARQQGDLCAVTVVPRFMTSLIEQEQLPFAAETWRDTGLNLPFAADWSDAITGRSFGGRQSIRLDDLLADFPVALLIGRSAEGPAI